MIKNQKDNDGNPGKMAQIMQRKSESPKNQPQIPQLPGYFEKKYTQTKQVMINCRQHTPVVLRCIQQYTLNNTSILN